MTETPEQPETPSEDDLSSLMGGFDFTPDWAKEEPGVKKTSLPREKGGSSRGGGPRAPRKSSRGKLKGVNVKPRRDAPPRRDQGGGEDGGGSRYGGDRNRDNRSYRPRHDRPPRPPRVPVHVDFIPEKKRLSKVVNVIRQTRRVFPLKTVAEKFMENPAFLSVKYTVKKKETDEEKFELFVCKANGMVFSDRAACEGYILEHGIDVYYESKVQEVDPPKGAFPGIGRHTKSNRLIGPPNWHGYQARMDEVRQEVDPTCPPDIFSRQVEMVRDEEVIEQWKAEVSRVVFYRLKREELEKTAPETDSPEPASGENVEASATPEEDSAAPAADSSSGQETVEPEVQESAEPEVDDRPFDLSREEVEVEFRANVLPKLIKTTQRAIMPGVMIDKMTDPSLLSSTRYHLNRETERPNSIIFALRPAFRHMRLNVFRHDGQLMVSSVEPHPLPEDLKVTPEIRQILDYVANHPLCHAKEALEAVAEQTKEVTPELVSHFRWLIEKGHLIEFHDESLLVPTAKTQKKPEETA